MKINNRKQFEIPFVDVLITQPNQAFTPRQILEQFARNEIVPSYNQSSDLLTDENYTDDQLLDGDVHEFDDKMEAESYIKENQFRHEQEQTTDSVRSDSPQGAAPSDPGPRSETPETEK